MLKTLISGTSSGLGKFLGTKFYAYSFNRDLLNDLSFYKEDYDLLIHAGFGRPVASQDPYQYISYATSIVDKLLSVKAKKFIFISSVDCYSPIINPYIRAKLDCEARILEKREALIIRLPSLYGSNMKSNQLLRIATSASPVLTLSSTSTFSLVSYRQVYNYIAENLEKTGTSTLMSDIVTLEDFSRFFGTRPTWGNFEYITPNVDTEDVLSPGTMLNNYKRFIDKGLRL